ncbi:MAG: DUF4190 domain-containing protein [Deltaproteobacteria bacterium]|jgi:hypothetical protein|nr:DUF4190 domain-containing protein [Deltaproteobacteria bacterium]
MDEQNIPVAKPVESNKPAEQAPQGPTSQASSKAMAALILGILALVCMGFLTGIPAIIIGKMELKDIKEGKSPKEGEGIAKVGFILGIVGTVLTCLVMLLGFALFFLGISAGMMDGLQEAALSI